MIRGNGRISGDDANHSGHIGHDHARTLCHTAHREHASVITQAVTAKRHSEFLRLGIRRHDGSSRIGASCDGQCRDGRRRTAFKRLHLQVLADNARRSHQNLLHRTAERVGDDAGRLARRLKALIAGSRIGDARINCHRTCDAMPHTIKMLFRHRDRSRAEHVCGEHRGARRRLIGSNQREVQTFWVSAESRMDTASLEALRRGNATRRQKRQIRVGVGGACVMQGLHRVPLRRGGNCMSHLRPPSETPAETAGGFAIREPPPYQDQGPPAARIRC